MERRHCRLNKEQMFANKKIKHKQWKQINSNGGN
jgi:hypothetical protein